MHTNSLAARLCFGGIHSIVLIVVTIYAGKKLVEFIKKKKAFPSVALAVLLILNSYFLCSFTGAIRYTMLWCGWDVAAFRLTPEQINTHKHEGYISADVKTGLEDSDGFKIMPFTLKIYKLGLIYIITFEGYG